VLFVIKYKLPPLAIGDVVAPSVAIGLGLGRIGCFLNGCCFGGPTDLPWAVRFPAPSPPFQRQVERGEIFVHGLKLSPRADVPADIVEVERGSAASEHGLAAGARIVAINGRRVDSGAAALSALFSIRPGEELELDFASRPPVAWTLPAAVELSRPIHPTQLYSAVDGIVLCFFLLAIYPFRRRDGEVLAWMMTLHPISRFLLEVVRVDEPGVFGTSLSIGQVVSLALLVGAAIMWAYLLTRPKGTVLPTSTTLSLA
jgi:phosphatidylglycerol:prolipoprotein diacylglycerol transferase